MNQMMMGVNLYNMTRRFKMVAYLILIIVIIVIVAMVISLINGNPFL